MVIRYTGETGSRIFDGRSTAERVSPSSKVRSSPPVKKGHDAAISARSNGTPAEQRLVLRRW